MERPLDRDRSGHCNGSGLEDLTMVDKNRWKLPDGHSADGNEPVVTREVSINGGRLALSLEGTLWDTLDRIADVEGHSIDSLCTAIAARRKAMPLRAAIIIF